MEISIEVLVVGLCIVIGVGFYFILLLSKYYKLWRYKPENDKGKKAEERRRELGNLQGTSPIERRSVFSLSSISRTNENKTKSGKALRKRNPFKRRR